MWTRARSVPRFRSQPDLHARLLSRQLIDLVHEELFAALPRSLLLVHHLHVALDFRCRFPWSNHRLPASAVPSSGSSFVVWLSNFLRGELVSFCDVPNNCSTCAADFSSCGDLWTPLHCHCPLAILLVVGADPLVRLSLVSSKVQGYLPWVVIALLVPP